MAYEENVMEHSWKFPLLLTPWPWLRNRYYAVMLTPMLSLQRRCITTLPKSLQVIYRRLSNTTLKKSIRLIKQIEKQRRTGIAGSFAYRTSRRFSGRLFITKKMPEEHVKIIKAADKISAYLKCQSELKAGNPEFWNRSRTTGSGD